MLHAASASSNHALLYLGLFSTGEFKPCRASL